LLLFTDETTNFTQNKINYNFFSFYFQTDFLTIIN
jgi:hypothetical protein